MTTLTATTQFINVVVKVTPGETAGQYNVETAPAIPYVTQPDTVVNYQIYETDGLNIIFTGMTVTPVNNHQLSSASVSVSGKQLTFSDSNTHPVTLNVTLNFKDEDGKEFMHDPQIKNDPQQ